GVGPISAIGYVSATDEWRRARARDRSRRGPPGGAARPRHHSRAACRRRAAPGGAARRRATHRRVCVAGDDGAGATVRTVSDATTSALSIAAARRAGQVAAPRAL